MYKKQETITDAACVVWHKYLNGTLKVLGIFKGQEKF